jgi:hypothetical protein
MIRSVALAIVLLGVSAVVMADVCLVGKHLQLYQSFTLSDIHS